VDIKLYIQDLFSYLDTYESSYETFDTEAFLQTYNGIYTVFNGLREQREQAVDVDRFFLDKIKKAPLTSSDLRQLIIQILITFFESEADVDGHSNKAYLYCRDLRAAKRDIAFFEGNLLPILFREGSLNNNYKLNAFILKEIARYYNKFGGRVNTNLSPEEFNAEDDPRKFLELMRRRLDLGVDLINDRTSLEFHLLGVDVFGKLGKKRKLYEQYLSDWNYLRKSSFWQKVVAGAGELWGKFKGAFKSFRYFKLTITQRSAAYTFYILVILFWILLAIYVPVKWQDYTNEKLEQFQQKAATIQSGSGN